MADKSNKRKSLGSWFPTASVIKSSSYTEDTISICLFYQYVRPLWSENRKQEVIGLIERYAEQLNVGGRVRVAQEGLNATISSSKINIRAFTEKLGCMDAHFKSTDFKYIDDLPPDRAFKDLKVLPVKELVFYGINAEEELAPGGVHLDPEDYHAKLKEDNTVVIDVRNAYESDIGRFGGQQSIGGAQLLLPDMRKSTDFPDWIEKEETKEMLSGKNVLMYCTGGVRCERASALLKSKYGDDIKEVYQLQGGIEKYLQSFPDGGFWQGKNFVFDKREAIGVGCRDGVGGIVQCSSNSNNKNNKNKNKGKQDSDDDGDDDENNNASSDQQMKRKKTKLENSETTVTNSGDDDVTTAAHTAIAATVLGKCCGCTVSWDRYVGKKKCATCGVPVLLCTACSSIKGMLDKQQLRQKKNKKLSGDDDDDEEEDEVMNKQCDENNINNNSSITMELLDSAITAALIKAAVNLPFNACNNNKNEKKKKKTKRQSKQQLTTERKQQAADMLLQRLKLLRCPLCVNENCTVPVEMLNFTANGTKAAAANSWDEGGCDATISTTATTTAAAGSRTTHSIGSSNKKIIFGDDGIDDAKYDSTVNSGKDAVTAASSSSNSSDKSAAATVVVVGKAASTVCKWGGGYSNREKKVKNRQQQEDVVDSSTSSSGGKKIARPCKWGSRCNRRSECWFQHDDGNDNVAVN